MTETSFARSFPNEDHAALQAAQTNGSALCTIVNIDGSFSRRTGAQLAVAHDGTTVGSLSDGCLERQLAMEVLDARQHQEKRLLRFGSGSPYIDFRLPCGSGLDILVDPTPDLASIRVIVDQLDQRIEAALDLPVPVYAPNGFLRVRRYMPRLKMMVFGEGPELSSFVGAASATGNDIEYFDKQSKGMALGRVPPAISADAWTAIVLLFHDHEWERALLGWALRTPAFYIGAQGGKKAREDRLADLLSQGFSPETLSRLRSPIGLIRHARDPAVLALSVLADIVAEYESRHPHP